MSLSGSRLLIGASEDNDGGDNSGTVFAYRFDGVSWSFTEKLHANDAQSGDLFGTSVSLSGNQALIGAYEDDDNGFRSGSAYVFDFDGSSWNQSQIIAADADSWDRFGDSVSLSGNRALIGAYGDDDNGNFSGATYIFNNLNDLIFTNDFEN